MAIRTHFPHQAFKRGALSVAIGLCVYSPATLAQTQETYEDSAAAVESVPDIKPFDSTPQVLREQLSNVPKVPLNALDSTAPLDTDPRFFVSGSNAVKPDAENIIDIAARKAATAPENRTDSAPWVLRSNQHPWPLNYAQPSGVARIVLGIPTANEVRLMLPGQLADFIDRTRVAVNKFIQDSLGVASQKRTIQLEQVVAWANRTTGQQSTLARAQWPVYQFSKEVYDKLDPYLEKVKIQSDAAEAQMLLEAQRLIDDLTRLMDAMQNHEAKLATYDIMVRLREGVVLFQDKVRSDDAKIIKVLTDLQLKVPRLSVPDVNPPSQEQSPLGGGWVDSSSKKANDMSHLYNPKPLPLVGDVVPAGNEYGAVLPDNRSQVKPSENQLRYAAPPERSAAVTEPEGTSIVGYLAFGLIGFGLLGFFKRFRKKGAAITPES